MQTDLEDRAFQRAEGHPEPDYRIREEAVRPLLIELRVRGWSIFIELNSNNLFFLIAAVFLDLL